MAKIDAEMAKAASDTPTMAGLLNSEMSSIGCCWRHSATKKTIISTPDPTSNPTMVGLRHPLALPCTSAKTNMNSDAEKVTNPNQSTVRDVGSRESSTLARAVSYTHLTLPTIYSV